MTHSKTCYEERKMITIHKNNLIISGIGLFIIAGIMLGLVVESSDVGGANTTSILTKVWVWNTEPNLYSVTLTPSTIVLSPGNTVTVNCTGNYWDYNGWQDIVNGSINATLFDTDVSSYNDTDDKNYHYTNSSCNLCSSLSSTNGTCTCLFEVEYYANNGTWQCNMTIKDSAGNNTQGVREFNFTDSLASATVALDPLVALDVGPTTLDYGNLSVTETSTEKIENITNYGNRNINISTYGYGGDNSTSGNNLSMICDLNDITIGLERYSTSNGTAFGSMTPLTNESTQIDGFTIIQRINDTQIEDDRNQTYWKMQIPLTVGGYCNGTVVFSATDAG